MLFYIGRNSLWCSEDGGTYTTTTTTSDHQIISYKPIFATTFDKRKTETLNLTCNLSF